MEKQKKKCFIVTPIGDEDSDTFRKAKGVIESVIKPILVEYGFDETKPAYEINEPGKIGQQVIERIVNDDLVIVNLTGNNPNVMYELAVRHATGKPIISICEKGTILPFDIIDDRTIFFVNDMLGVQELKMKLLDFLKEIKLNSKYTSNPILSSTKLQLEVPEINSIEQHIKLIHNTLEMSLFQRIPEEKRKVWINVILHKKQEGQECDFIKLFVDIAIKLQEIGYYFDARLTKDLLSGELFFISFTPDTLLLEDISNIVQEMCANYNMSCSVEIIQNIA